MRGWLATRWALGVGLDYTLCGLGWGIAPFDVSRCVSAGAAVFLQAVGAGQLAGHGSLAAVVVEVEFPRPLAGFCGVCWVGSRLCFSARRGPAATAAVLQLAESAWVFRLGLTALRFLGRVLPELAGLGVNVKSSAAT